MGIRRRFMAISATAALALSAGVSAPVAQAAAATFVATPNGMVGLQQEIVVRAPRSSGQIATINFSSGTLSNAGQTAINAQGYGSLAWTPTSAGQWTISGTVGGASLGTTTITVAAMPTTTAALVPNLVQVGVSNPVTVVVSAPLGVLPPTGTVTLRNQNQNVIGTAALSASSGTSSSATLTWTPANSESLIASYAPAAPAGFASSVSETATPQTTTAQVPVALRFPPVLYVGTPTIIGAQTGNGVTAGSAAFFFDNVGIIGSTPTDGTGGIAAVWTPPASGVHTLSTQFTSNNGRYTGTSSQVVNIQPAKAADAITVTPNGQGAWPASSPIRVVAGSTVTLATTTASGATAVLSESGPCVINANTLTALSAGQCTITATSPGSGVIAPDTETYVVTISAAGKKKR